MPRLNFFTLPLCYGRFTAAMCGWVAVLLNSLCNSAQGTPSLISHLQKTICRISKTVCRIWNTEYGVGKTECHVWKTMHNLWKTESHKRKTVSTTTDTLTPRIKTINHTRNGPGCSKNRKRPLNECFLPVSDFLITEYICADASPPV